MRAKTMTLPNKLILRAYRAGDLDSVARLLALYVPIYSDARFTVTSGQWERITEYRLAGYSWIVWKSEGDVKSVEYQPTIEG